MSDGTCSFRWRAQAGEVVGIDGDGCPVHQCMMPADHLTLHYCDCLAFPISEVGKAAGDPPAA